TAADGVERPADEAHRHEEPGTRTLPEGGALAAEGEEAPDDIDAEGEQDARDPWRGRLTVEIGQNGRAGQRADESGPREDPDRTPVNVAELVMGDAGDQSRSQLGEVHRRRGGRRCRTRSQEQCRRGHPIGHAEGPVDELSDEADEAENDELTHALAFLETLQGHTTQSVEQKIALEVFVRTRSPEDER